MNPTPRGARPRRVPQRTCIACREVGDKRALVRLVHTAAGIVVDPTGKRSGRGAYLHRQRRCWARALHGDQIDRALNVQLSDSDRERLADFAAQLVEQQRR